MLVDTCNIMSINSIVRAFPTIRPQRWRYRCHHRQPRQTLNEEAGWVYITVHFANCLAIAPPTTDMDLNGAGDCDGRYSNCKMARTSWICLLKGLFAVSTLAGGARGNRRGWLMYVNYRRFDLFLLKNCAVNSSCEMYVDIHMDNTGDEMMAGMDEKMQWWKSADGRVDRRNCQGWRHECCWRLTGLLWCHGELTWEGYALRQNMPSSLHERRGYLPSSLKHTTGLSLGDTT